MAIIAKLNELENNKQRRTFEFQAGEYWFANSYLPFVDGGGKTTGFYFSLRDITEEKATARELQEKNEQYRVLVETLPHGVEEIDRNGVVIFSNNAHHELLGCEDKELIGKNIFEYVYDNEETKREAIDFLNNILKNEPVPQPYVKKNTRKDGKIIDVQVDWNYKRDKNGKITGFTSIVTDITARKKAMEQQKEATEKVKQADRLKSAFLSNISHEIRTPLNAIMGFADLLKRNKLPTEKKELFINTIQNRGNHLLNVINDLLNLSKIKAGMETLSPQKCYLNQCLSDMEMNYQSILRLRHLNTLKIKFVRDEKAAKILLNIDVLKLTQIFTNLIDNSLRFTTEGTISYGYQQSKRHDYFTFFIKNSGIDYKAAHQAIMFDDLSYVQQQGKTAHSATGVGLSISKELVQLFGGHFNIEQTKTGGTNFYFTIPVHSESSKNKKVKAARKLA